MLQLASPCGDAADPFVGTAIGYYRIVRPIGGGRSGAVYQVVHELIGQRAAVKILTKARAGESVARRFLDEARALSRARDPGLVQIFDVGSTTGGSPYLLMEYLEGESLRARLQRQPIDLATAVRLGRQLALALSATGRSGIVHGDIKPENIMIVPDPAVDGGERTKLVDFGIARVPADGQVETLPGMVVGTATYMAPEQSLAEPVGSATDIYALGVLLSELFTGAPPFRGGREAVLRAHVFDEPPDPGPAVPLHLRALIRAMLAKPPVARPRIDLVLERLTVTPPTLKVLSTETGGPVSAHLAENKGGGLEHNSLPVQSNENNVLENQKSPTQQLPPSDGPPRPAERTVVGDTTEEAPIIIERPPARLWTLRVVYSESRILAPQQVHPLQRGLTPIGRDAPMGVSLCDGRTSRTHAQIKLDGERPLVTDLGSRNGIRVNGERVTSAVLGDNDVLTMGETLLVVRSERTGVFDARIPSIIGDAPSMRAARAALSRAAPAGSTVLLMAPSGCGKELAARALHDYSGRCGPFVAVNCAAIPESLAESILFGHVAGAFTGTGAKASQGLVRSAEGGTLFLDEVGELSPALQPKLLRFLQDGMLLPLGATRPIACNVRIVAATNRDLPRAAERGDFRGDLYARLAQFTLGLPPIRDRREDILPLVRHALGEKHRIAPALAERLLLHGWPFNVREIFSLAETVRIRAGGETLVGPELVADRLITSGAADEPDPSRGAGAAAPEPSGGPPPRPRRALSVLPEIPNRQQLLQLLERHRGVISDIALETGRSRKQVYRWLSAHGLDYENHRRKG